MNYSKTLEGRIAARIDRKRSPILLREDFDDLGGYDQVGRALLALTKSGKLIKIGYGLYAKAKVSSLTGNTVPMEPLPALAQRALDRLGAAPRPSRAATDYQEGRSTQVPTGRLISINKRISRKIGYNNIAVSYDNVPGKAVIEEVALELGIDPAFVEKDWYVVQLIREITNADLFGAQTIFAGGTALSKDHRLLQRFSEDIDFRLILPPNTSASGSQQRKLLSAIRERLHQLITAHFPTDAVKWKSRDENRYFAFEIDYPSVMASSHPLRPHLQIEFTEATLSLPPLTRPVSSFIAELTGTGPEVPEVACVDPVENAADKLSALIWRVPDRVRAPEDDDPDLARHIHDLAALQFYAISHADFRQLAMDAIRQDDDRCEKIKGLPLNKKFQLLLEVLLADAEYRREYTRFVQGMSYATGSVPTYDEAIAKLKTLIDHIERPEH